MDLSLIICTRDRADRLDGCLSALLAITFDRPWELILVNNASSDHTAEVLKAFVAKAPMPAKYVFESRPGLASARNAGLRVATGDIVAFTDDDCYPASDFAQCIARAFEDQTLGFISGRINLFNPDDWPVTINESPHPRQFYPGQFLYAGDVQGANMALRRAALIDAGAFDPLFGSGAYFPSEDIDAVARVCFRGWKGAYVPDVVVWHDHGRKEKDVPALMKSYDIGRGAYYAKLIVLGRPIFGATGLLRSIKRRAVWELYGFLRYFYVRVRGVT